jgi:hypothetical protein
MTSIKNIFVAALLFSAGLFGTAQAAEQTIKPLQGVSFHAGTKHAVAYFLSENRTCKLVLTSADDANFEPARYEAAIDAGKSTNYPLVEGKSIEFACQAEAQAMNVKSLETVAGN